MVRLGRPAKFTRRARKANQVVATGPNTAMFGESKVSRVGLGCSRTESVRGRRGTYHLRRESCALFLRSCAYRRRLSRPLVAPTRLRLQREPASGGMLAQSWLDHPLVKFEAYSCCDALGEQRAPRQLRLVPVKEIRVSILVP